MRSVVAILATTILAASCGDASDELTVTKEEYGDRWPIKADKAVLHCDSPDIAYIDVAGKWYALNGGALRQNLPRADEIRKDVNIVDMADFAERAIAICEKNR